MGSDKGICSQSINRQSAACIKSKPAKPEYGSAG
jgi:hypothetical protein